MTRILTLPSWNFAWISSDKIKYLCEKTTAFKPATESNIWIEKKNCVLESLLTKFLLALYKKNKL